MTYLIFATFFEINSINIDIIQIKVKINANILSNIFQKKYLSNGEDELLKIHVFLLMLFFDIFNICHFFWDKFNKYWVININIKKGIKNINATAANCHDNHDNWDEFSIPEFIFSGCIADVKIGKIGIIIIK